MAMVAEKKEWVKGLVGPEMLNSMAMLHEAEPLKTARASALRGGGRLRPRRPRRGHAELGEAVEAAGPLRVHVLEGIEVPHLGRDLRGKPGGIEARDPPHAGAGRAHSCQ